MCIIIAKDKGVKLPNKKTMKHCFDTNPDGAGLMFVRPRGKLVTVDKGYMTWEAFYRAVRSYKFTKDDVVALHFRNVSTRSARAQCENACGLHGARCQGFTYDQANSTLAAL